MKEVGLCAAGKRTFIYNKTNFWMHISLQSQNLKRYDNFFNMKLSAVFYPMVLSRHLESLDLVKVWESKAIAAANVQCINCGNNIYWLSRRLTKLSVHTIPCLYTIYIFNEKWIIFMICHKVFTPNLRYLLSNFIHVHKMTYITICSRSSSLLGISEYLAVCLTFRKIL